MLYTHTHTATYIWKYIKMSVYMGYMYLFKTSTQQTILISVFISERLSDRGTEKYSLENKYYSFACKRNWSGKKAQGSGNTASRAQRTGLGSAGSTYLELLVCGGR